MSSSHHGNPHSVVYDSVPTFQSLFLVHTLQTTLHITHFILDKSLSIAIAREITVRLLETFLQESVIPQLLCDKVVHHLTVIAELARSRSSILIEPYPSFFMVLAIGMFRGRVRRRRPGHVSRVQKQSRTTSGILEIFQPKPGFVFRALSADTQPMSRPLQ